MQPLTFIQKIICIVCFQISDGGIGNNGAVLYPSSKLPGDMDRFKKFSIGKLDQNHIGNVVIMGYKTWLSLKKFKPLPNRINIVISHCEHPEISALQNCFCVYSIAEAINLAQTQFKDRDVVIAGGAEIYNKTFHLCDEIYTTEVVGDLAADTKIDMNLITKDFAIQNTETKTHQGITYHFVNYTKIRQVA